ncbi:hypothetical protein KAI32_04310 [Candidatus Pacearchaeota archaeon]|nr:hypothetical protein [Candidatus Pacearchaeota archaeon]
MNKTYFQVLRLTVPSGQYKYTDEGYVDSISDETLRLSNLYGMNILNYNKNRDKTVIGKKFQSGLNIHIFYLDQGLTRRNVRLRGYEEIHARRNIRLRGHEETHALEGMEGLDYLTDALRQNQNVKINLKEVDEEEIRAELGALYALNLRGLAPGDLSSLVYDKDFTKARELYKQSKQPQKRSFFF